MSIVRLAVLLLLPVVALAAGSPPDAESLAGFELKLVDGVPCGWSATPASTVSPDESEKHGGSRSLKIVLNAGHAAFTSVARYVPIDFTASKIEVRGFLRASGDVNASLWLRLDGAQPNVAFTGGEKIAPVGQWIVQSISLDAKEEARSIVYGARINGSGAAWIDDIEILADGKPIAAVPDTCRLTALDQDRAFDAGSKIALEKLSEAQIDALVLTAKVWGFLKYHHATLTSGQRHWDYELFRHLPAILSAKDRAGVERELTRWIESLGKLPVSSNCALTDDAPMRPRLAWIDDPALGRRLRSQLHAVHAARVCGQQFYLTLAPDVGNPVFDNEPAYREIPFPDPGYQLLAAMRFWNMVEYWFPYRDLIDENWDAVLRDTIPRVSLAKSRDEFELEMAALVARIDDSHANLWSAVPRRPPAGACQLPVSLRIVEGQFVIKGILSSAPEDASLQVGDVLTGLDRGPVTNVVERVRRYYGASNEPARLRDMARVLTRGECGSAGVEVERGGALRLDARRIPAESLSLAGAFSNDAAGDTFRKLAPDIAYLKLSSVKAADVAGYVDASAGSKALIIDIRNYPSEFVVFALGELLVDTSTPFARFTHADPVNPGAFIWSEPVSLTPRAPHFGGRVIILVDEMTMSQAEYTALALRAAPHAIVVGMRTTGADGDVSNIPLPGNLRAAFSGLGVYLPDRRPTQQVGVSIDVPCAYTIAGIRAGRDEILECALREVAK